MTGSFVVKKSVAMVALAVFASRLMGAEGIISVKELEQAKPSERNEMLRELVRVKLKVEGDPTEYIGILNGFLDDESDEVRGRSMFLVYRFAHQHRQDNEHLERIDLEGVGRLLESTDSAVVEAAISVFGIVGKFPEELMPTLKRLAGSEEWRVRRVAQELYLDKAPASDIEQGMRAQLRGSKLERLIALRTFGRRTELGARAISELVEVIEAEEEDGVRRAGFEALTMIFRRHPELVNPERFERVLDNIKSREVPDDVAAWAVTLMGEMGKADQKLVERLVPLINDQTMRPKLRGGFVQVLGKFPELAEREKGEIERALKDESEFVRYSASRVLEQIEEAK